MIVQWIWSTTFFKLENPYSLKWLKGSLRHQAGMSSFQNIRNRNRRCALLDGRRMHSKKVYTWRLCRAVFGRMVWSLSIRYSSLSQIVPICFLFEPVVDFTTHKDRRVKFMHTFGPLPPKWFSVRPCGGSLNTKILMAKNKSILEQTNQATSPKTDVVRFSAWVFQQLLI